MVQLPDREVMLELPPEELAGYLLLRVVDAWRQHKSSGSRSAFGVDFAGMFGWGDRHDEEAILALAEAWSWLLREGLLVPYEPPYAIGVTHQLTPSRRARELCSIEAFRRLRDQQLLPRSLVHPLIQAEGAAADFHSGHYDHAVWKAFRHIEVSVRTVIAAPPDMAGVSLMRNAFNPSEGALRDTKLPHGEQESMMHLFAGAIGMFRNSTGHRNVGFSPQECVELLVFASYLVRMLEERKGAMEAT